MVPDSCNTNCNNGKQVPEATDDDDHDDVDDGQNLVILHNLRQT